MNEQDQGKKPELRRVRIQCGSGGIATWDFKVTDVETGQELKRIVSVEFEPITAKTVHYPKARILMHAEMDIEAEATFVTRQFQAVAALTDDSRATLHEIAEERGRQIQRWGNEHDNHHEDFEWLGLIARYAAVGEYVKAAAVAMAASEAKRRVDAKRWATP